jgi:MOSC domain-containing protein
MKMLGRVESLWRYPVKSMRGEELGEAFAGFAGVYGDRAYAFRSSSAPRGFPFFTGREQDQMLRHRARYRHAERMTLPPNLAEAEALAPGLTAVHADAADRMVDVETPSGAVLAVDDPQLLDRLSEGKREGLTLSLLRSDRAFSDCRPVSLISVQTTRQLSEEVGAPLDKRRFRANVYVDLAEGAGFGEDGWVGRRARIGAKAEILILERDPRCKMITLDPDTAQANPEVMRCVAKDHGGTAGVYAAVLVEGLIRSGDAISLLD